MERRFNSIADFVAYMRRQVATLPEAQTHALHKAADLVLEDVKGRLGTYQPGWDQLAPATVEARERAGFTPDDPLLASGKQRDSYEVRVSSPHHAAVGSDDPTATYSELGTRTEPPRPVLAASGAAKEREVVHVIGRTIHDHLMGRG